MSSEERGSSLEVDERTERTREVMSHTNSLMKNKQNTIQSEKEKGYECLLATNTVSPNREKETTHEGQNSRENNEETFIINSKEYEGNHFQRQMKEVTHITNDAIRENNLKIKNKVIIEPKSEDDLLNFVGDGFVKKKNPKHLRIYYNNCNGMEVHKLALSKMRFNKVK